MKEKDVTRLFVFVLFALIVSFGANVTLGMDGVILIYLAGLLALLGVFLWAFPSIVAFRRMIHGLADVADRIDGGPHGPAAPPSGSSDAASISR